MVDDMRAALEQARDDSRVKAIVLESILPRRMTASDAIYSALVKVRARNRCRLYGSLAHPVAIIFCGGKFLMATKPPSPAASESLSNAHYEQLFNKVGLASVFSKRKFKDMLNGARRSLRKSASSCRALS